MLTAKQRELLQFIDERLGDLGENGDAALALEIVGIHRAFGHPLVIAERAGLLQQAVDQRGLAMVDMGDDGDIAKMHGGLMLNAGQKARASYGGDI